MASTEAASAIEPRVDPFAVRLWNLLRDRSEVDRRHVYEALHERLGLASLPAKQEQAAEAIRRFIERREGELESARKGNSATRTTPPAWALGKPSRRRYDDFRAGEHAPSEWPSSQFIRNAFGGDWNAALVAIGEQPPIDILARRLTSRGRRYTRTEIITALRIWVDHVDQDHAPDAPLRQTDYAKWARSQLSSPSQSFGRIPSIPAIRKYLGRWPEVLVALGCPHRSALPRGGAITKSKGMEASLADEPAAELDLRSPPPDPPRNEWHICAGSDTAKERAQALIEWLRWLGEQLPEDQRPRLRAQDFDRYVASIRRVSLARGTPLRPPSARSYETCADIGGWNRAKHLAGLLDARFVAKRSTRAFSERELVDAVLNAMNELGPDMNRAQYSRWRDECSRGEGRVDRIPSEAVLRQRFADGGHWRLALQNALRRASALGLHAVAPGGYSHADRRAA